MHQLLPFIVIGLASGAVYGLAGMGLVLTFKTSGILNFGYGAVAALDVFAFYFLNTDHGVPWPVAAVLCLLVVAPVLGLLLELLARSLANASETIKVVATVGLILIVQAIGQFWYPDNPPTFPHFLSQSTVDILGVYITWEQIILFLFSVVAAAVLYWFFRSVRLGIVMRGVVDNAELVSMAGDDPVRVRRWAWVIGSVFASVAGLMLAPALQMDGTTLTMAVFAAFGAAAIGSFSSLPLTFAGGLVVGIATAFVDKYSATISWIAGLPPALPFVILVLVLIVIPRDRLVQRRLVAVTRVRRSYQAPLRIRLGSGAVAIALLALVPVLQGDKIILWSGALIDIILFMSLGLLVRRSGQISLCQLAFAAVGAAAFGHFASSFHLPWLLALVLATLVAVPVGALVAIPAVRVSGVFLALATLGFGILVEQVFYTQSFMFGQSTLGVQDPRPNVSIGGWNLSSDSGFYYVLLIITVLVVVAAIWIGNGRLGRLLEAMADSPLALETQGTTTTMLKVIVFCVAAAMASLAGALTGQLYQFAVGGYFESFNSITLVVLVVIITVGEPWYALIAAVGYAIIPGYLPGGNAGNILLLLFGLGAIAAAHGARGGTTPQALRSLLDRLGGRTANLDGAGTGLPLAAEAQAATAQAAPAPAQARPAPALGPRGTRPVGPLRRHQGGQGGLADGARRGHHRPARPQRRGQDDHVQRVQRPRPPHGRAGPAARGRRQPLRCGRTGPARPWPDLPALPAVRQPDRAAEHRDRAGGADGRAQPAGAAGRLPAGQPAGRGGRGGGHGPDRHCQAREYAGRPAHGRAAAPRRACPGAGRAVRHAPARRAVVGA